MTTQFTRPLFFPRAGLIYSNSNAQLAISSYVGRDGYSWSSTMTSRADLAYNLFFVDTTVNSSASNYYRYQAFPVRCLVN